MAAGKPAEIDLYNPAANLSLVRYAVLAQILLVAGSQAAAADQASLSQRIVSELVSGQDGDPLGPVELRHLAEIQDALMWNSNSRQLHMSLVAFHGRLFPGDRSDVAVPARWARVLASQEPRSFAEAIIAGEAMVAFVRTNTKLQESFTAVLDRLLVVGGLPGREGIEALQLIARFADTDLYLPRVFDRIEHAIKVSPTGFRAWRAVSLIVRRAAAPRGAASARWIADVRERVEALFELAPLNAHPSRSLDLEAAGVAPDGWSWANKRLAAEAGAVETTPRRLGYAALAYFERTGGAESRRHRAVLAALRDRAAAAGAESPHMRWVANNIAALRDEGAKVGDLPRALLRPAEAAASAHFSRGFPPRLRDATTTLFLHGLLSNHGLVRRHALDALRVAGLGSRVCEALADLVEPEAVPDALLERAAFAVAFLGEASPQALTVLTRALTLTGTAPDVLGAVEAAAWSAGELYATSDENIPKTLATDLVSALAARGDSSEARRVTRAAAYSLAVTVPPAPERKALTRQVHSLEDEYARRFAEMGRLRFSSAKRGVTPLVQLPLAIEDPGPPAQLA